MRTLMFIFCFFGIFVCEHAVYASKIGFVDTQRILRESRPSHEADRLLEREFSQRLQHVKDLEKRIGLLQNQIDDNRPPLSYENRHQLERKYNELVSVLHTAKRESAEALNVRRGEEYQRIIRLANAAVREIAGHDNYDAILQEAVYVNKNVDITDQVLERLNHLSVSAKKNG